MNKKPKKIISKRGRRNRRILKAVIVLIIIVSTQGLWKKPVARGITAAFSNDESTVSALYLQPIALTRTELPYKVSESTVRLNVPLVNQNDDPALYNGCEVASLAMILEYNGINKTKNELADAIAKVPFASADGTMGNPNIGFVGSIQGNESPGYSVYHQPLVDLANQYVTSPMSVVDLTEKSFDDVLNALRDGQPVLAMTTVSYAETANIDTFWTDQGDVQISWDIHCVAITGFDEDSIYINDPYGEKDKQVNRDNFIASWTQMGSQAIYISNSEITT